MRGPREGLAAIDTVVLAGGLGTRLSGAIGNLPKVLAPVGDRPFLDHLLRFLTGQGIARIMLCLGHAADQVTAWLARSHWSGCVSTIIEPTPLGTAGALRLARQSIGSDPALVVNGDTLIDADLGVLLAAHRAGAAEVSLLCAEVLEGGRYGSVEVDAHGRVRRFVEKDPTRSGPALVSAGYSLLSAALLDRIAAGDARSLEHDVLARMPPGSIRAVTGRFRFIDIGTPDSLAQATQFLRLPVGAR